MPRWAVSRMVSISIAFILVGEIGASIAHVGSRTDAKLWFEALLNESSTMRM
jgi:hypothetical protein